MSLNKGTKKAEVSPKEIVANFESRFNTLKQNKDKIEDVKARKTVKQTIKNMEGLSNQINKSINNADPELVEKYNKLYAEFEDMKPGLLNEIQKLEQASNIASGNDVNTGSTGGAPAMSQQEQEVLQLQAQAEIMDNVAASIVEDMKDLNEVTLQLKDQIDQQHDVIVRIDDTISDAKEDMVKGNEDLQVAEEDQKKTCNIA